MGLDRLIVGAVIGAAILSGCATTPDQQAADATLCQSWGAKPGSASYTDCRARLELDRRESRRKAWAGFVGNIGPYQGSSTVPGAPPIPGPPAIPGQTAVMTPSTTACFLQGERVSGMNKICMYDCLGSAYAVTQNAVSLCMPTANR